MKVMVTIQEMDGSKFLDEAKAYTVADDDTLDIIDALVNWINLRIADYEEEEDG